MNYSDDIRIDETALDVEWLRQPILTFKYAKLVSKHQQYLDKLKEKINVAKAELDKKIRINPKKYSIDKVTENAVFSAIIQDPKYQALNEEFINAKYELDMAQNAVWALRDKKSALENLVKLHGQSYFAGPSVPRDLNSEWEKSEKQSISNKKIGTSSFKRTK